MVQMVTLPMIPGVTLIIYCLVVVAAQFKISQDISTMDRIVDIHKEVESLIYALQVEFHCYVRPLNSMHFLTYLMNLLILFTILIYEDDGVSL